MKQMQGLDAAFIALEQPDAPVHIGSLSIYDPSTAPGGFVRFKDILSFVESRLQLAPSMRQKMVKVPFGLDYPYWVNDSSFDLEYHVRHIALPKPGDWRQLCIQSARIFARPLDLTRPPWEITVVEGLDNVEGVPKGSFAMLTKIHHSAIDGASGVEIMMAMHSMAANAAEISTIDSFRPDADPSQMGMLARGVSRSMVLGPLRQANAMRKSLPGAYRAAKGLIKKDFDLKALSSTPRTRFNGVVSPHRMFDGVTFDLAAVKSARVLSPGSTLNDVMLSIVGGAMRKYLEEKSDLPEASMTAMAPISVRAENEKSTMGNQVSAMFVPLGSHVPTAAARMEYVHEETVKAKAMSKALGARQSVEVSQLTPAPIMNIGASIYSRLKLADRIKPSVNTIVTNVPGPPVPIYSAGAKMVATYGQLCLVDGVRLGHVVNSYKGDITVGFVADRDAMPDPDFYAECLKESFADHMEAVKNHAKHTETTKVTTVKAKPSTEKPLPKAVKTTKVPTVKASGRAQKNGAADKPVN